MRLFSRGAIGWLMLIPSSLLGVDRSTTTSAPADVELCIKAVGEPALIGRVGAWRLPGELEIETRDGKTRQLASANIDRVGPVGSRDGRQSTRSPATSESTRLDEWTVQLADSSRILANIIGGSEELLTIRNVELGEVKLPIEGLSRLWRSGQKAPAGGGEEDVIELTSGDRVHGVIAGVTADGLRLGDGEERMMTWNKIQSVVFAGIRSEKPEGVWAMVALSDGSRIAARQLEWKEGGLRIGFASGLRARLGAKSIQSVEVRGGRRDWLSDRPPDEYQSTPYFETRWAYRLDKNAEGRPLRMGRVEYEHGIGLHSACTATWRLGGKYGRFTALIGIDDGAGSAADADVKILLDGKELEALSSLHWNEPPKPIDVSVIGGDRLTIEVGFGKHGEVQDRVDVVNPAMIRK